jgi:hypothetical protein
METITLGKCERVAARRKLLADAPMPSESRRTAGPSYPQLVLHLLQHVPRCHDEHPPARPRRVSSGEDHADLQRLQPDASAISSRGNRFGSRAWRPCAGVQGVEQHVLADGSPGWQRHRRLAQHGLDPSRLRRKAASRRAPARVRGVERLDVIERAEERAEVSRTKDVPTHRPSSRRRLRSHEETIHPRRARPPRCPPRTPASPALAPCHTSPPLRHRRLAASAACRWSSRRRDPRSPQRQHATNLLVNPASMPARMLVPAHRRHRN